MSSLRILRRYPNSGKQKGLVAIFFTLAFLFLCGIAALAIDVNHAFMNKSKLQNSVDAAALAGATLAIESGAGANGVISAVTDLLNNVGNLPGNAGSELSGLSGLSDLNADSFPYTLSNGATLNVQFASYPDGSFSSTYPGSGDGVYVRVAIAHYPLNNFFVTLFGINKYVSASAVAGKVFVSPSNIVPLGICHGGGTTDTGYNKDEVYAIKGGNPELGKNNYGLLDLGKNSAEVSQFLAKDYPNSECDDDNYPCISSDDTVYLKSGVTSSVGKALNTRFNIYQGGFTESEYPPDEYIKEPETPATIDATSDEVIFNMDDFDYTEYKPIIEKLHQGNYSDCGTDSEYCPDKGIEGRRTVIVPIVDCLNYDDGKSVDIVTFGCFYLLQSVDTNGSDQTMFGQFITECKTDNGVPIDKSVDDGGPYKIVLYKDPLSKES